MDREKRRESLKRRYGNRASSAGMGGPGGGRPGGHGPQGPGVGPGRQRVRMGGKPKDSAQTIRRLMQYINEDKAKIAVAFICILLNTGATLAGSYMLRPIINIYIAPTDGSRRTFFLPGCACHDLFHRSLCQLSPGQGDADRGPECPGQAAQ